MEIHRAMEIREVRGTMGRHRGSRAIPASQLPSTHHRSQYTDNMGGLGRTGVLMRDTAGVLTRVTKMLVLMRLIKIFVMIRLTNIILFQVQTCFPEFFCSGLALPYWLGVFTICLASRRDEVGGHDLAGLPTGHLSLSLSRSLLTWLQGGTDAVLALPLVDACFGIWYGCLT